MCFINVVKSQLKFSTNDGEAIIFALYVKDLLTNSYLSLQRNLFFQVMKLM